MKTMIAQWLVSLALAFLKTLPDILWDAFWAHIFDAVQEAEKVWVESGRGEEKKREVIEAAFVWITEHRKLGPIRKKALKIMLHRVIDTIVEELNRTVGKGWASRIPDLKARSKQLLPLVLRHLVD